MASYTTVVALMIVCVTIMNDFAEAGCRTIRGQQLNVETPGKECKSSPPNNRGCTSPTLKCFNGWCVPIIWSCRDGCCFRGARPEE